MYTVILYNDCIFFKEKDDRDGDKNQYESILNVIKLNVDDKLIWATDI